MHTAPARKARAGGGGGRGRGGAGRAGAPYVEGADGVEVAGGEDRPLKVFAGLQRCARPGAARGRRCLRGQRVRQVSRHGRWAVVARRAA